ncbi:MAG: hypothetical protein HC892_19550 [Saprospiraceae bacterium]|nr:hypothetical protein [Saprospiraceae bacterium]
MDYIEKYVADAESDISFPIFRDELKQLHGRTVIIEGYVIPIEETLENTAIILSAFPYTQCFFCGSSGPESVMDIIPLNQLKGLSTDEKVQFKGKLKLNDTNWEQLIYILEDAEIVP